MPCQALRVHAWIAASSSTRTAHPRTLPLSGPPVLEASTFQHHVEGLREWRHHSASASRGSLPNPKASPDLRITAPGREERRVTDMPSTLGTPVNTQNRKGRFQPRWIIAAPAIVVGIGVLIGWPRWQSWQALQLAPACQSSAEVSTKAPGDFDGSFIEVFVKEIDDYQRSRLCSSCLDQRLRVGHSGHGLVEGRGRGRGRATRLHA